jgi:hypothetical protein
MPRSPAVISSGREEGTVFRVCEIGTSVGMNRAFLGEK